MLIRLPVTAPIFTAYDAQKQLFDATLDAAIQQAAKQVGPEGVAALFKVESDAMMKVA